MNLGDLIDFMILMPPGVVADAEIERTQHGIKAKIKTLNGVPCINEEERNGAS